MLSTISVHQNVSIRDSFGEIIPLPDDLTTLANSQGNILYHFTKELTADDGSSQVSNDDVAKLCNSTGYDDSQIIPAFFATLHDGKSVVLMGEHNMLALTEIRTKPDIGLKRDSHGDVVEYEQDDLLSHISCLQYGEVYPNETSSIFVPVFNAALTFGLSQTARQVDFTKCWKSHRELLSHVTAAAKPRAPGVQSDGDVGVFAQIKAMVKEGISEEEIMRHFVNGMSARSGAAGQASNGAGDSDNDSDGATVRG